jgi:hypothetical protein
MADTRKLLADLVDAFNQAWTRPEHWLEGRTDELAPVIRDYWAAEREKWASNLLGIIQTWLRYPEDGSFAPTEEALPSWEQVVDHFDAKMRRGAETVEMEILRMPRRAVTPPGALISARRAVSDGDAGESAPHRRQ